MAGKMTLYKLVVLGDGGVGKTALTIQLCMNHFVETYDPTIEDSYRKQVVIDTQSCMLEVLDTAGQEEYTALRDQWIRDGQGFILVYSIASRASFNRIRKFYNQIQRVKESVYSPSSSPNHVSHFRIGANGANNNNNNAPVMLVGNKADRVTEREVSTQEGSALAREMDCHFVEASAKSCINVEKAFYDVVRSLREQRKKSGYASGGGLSEDGSGGGGGGGNGGGGGGGIGHRPQQPSTSSSSRGLPGFGKSAFPSSMSDSKKRNSRDGSKKGSRSCVIL